MHFLSHYFLEISFDFPFNIFIRFLQVFYLRINVLEHKTRAMMKSREGVNTPDASNSNSQCIPVKPTGHWHSYFFGGLWSRQRPPLRQGNVRHSLSLTHVLPEILKPAGHLSQGKWEYEHFLQVCFSLEDIFSLFLGTCLFSLGIFFV